jgi:hypothetical protein
MALAARDRAASSEATSYTVLLLAAPAAKDIDGFGPERLNHDVMIFVRCLTSN